MFKKLGMTIKGVWDVQACLECSFAACLWLYQWAYQNYYRMNDPIHHELEDQALDLNLDYWLLG